MLPFKRISKSHVCLGCNPLCNKLQAGDDIDILRHLPRLMNAQPCCSSRKALQLTSLILQILLLIRRFHFGREKEMRIGVLVVHGMVLNVMRSLAMLLALTSVAAVSMVLSIPATVSSALSTCRGLTSQIITSISLKYRQDLVMIFRSLTYLNLSNSLFSGQIPSEISKLSKLSTLDLSFNGPKFDAYGIPLKLTKGNMRSLVQNLTAIKQLHLNWVEMYSTVSDILVNASSLTSLRFGYCELNGEFPVGIFHLPNLEVLDVKGNSNLTGYFPNFNMSNNNSIRNLHSLNLLDISRCHFYPLVPSSLGNLTQLNYLDMFLFNDIPNNNSTGQLVSEYSLSWIASLTNLYSLSLGENSQVLWLTSRNFHFYTGIMTN
ncbi:probable LRR receptor-like serine/threonine-protein kinase At4g36180 isoform X1 [Prunus persica]|uniref:probable LRR receptor-like serine/threonine-protein kinase At4g36180 isoform X1 n=1 Tax=Prunus persica TaxID=3760 RepID=UPI0009AB6750|nr:probable LRR receptor-like serine/threonine-protein kinase At4g36180 isoform X1 [Prunus persica]